MEEGGGRGGRIYDVGCSVPALNDSTRKVPLSSLFFYFFFFGGSGWEWVEGAGWDWQQRYSPSTHYLPLMPEA